MVLFTITFLLGQILGPDAEAPPGRALLACAVALAIAARIVSRRLEPATRALAAALAGAVLAAPLAPPADCWRPAEGEVAKRRIVGTVIEPAVPTADRLRLVLDARIDGVPPLAICGRVRISLREPPDEPPRIGDRLRLHATLRRPLDFANPSAVGSVESLVRRGTWVVGGAARIGSIEPPAEDSAARRLDRLRGLVRAAIGRAATEPQASLVRAIVLGELRAVDRTTSETFAASGLAHLLSVSGLHVGAVWAVVAFVALRLLARSERLLLAIDVRAAAAALAVGPAGLYAALAGGGAPTERAVAFVALAALAASFGRETRAFRVLAIAALGLSLLHPGIVRSISFQLSFAAVVGLVAAARPARDPPSSLAERLARIASSSIRLSFAASLATAPLVAFHFQRVSPIGLVTNPLLVPTLGVPATLIGLVGGALSVPFPTAGEAALALAAVALGVLLRAAEVALLVPGASFRVPMPSLLEIAILYGAIALFYLPGRPRRALAALLALLALADAAFWTIERRGGGELRVRFLDVGQGDAAILELPDGRVIVIDGGGMPGTFDVGERVVAPALWARKIRRVDVLVATHGDRDHQGGLRFLARELAPHELWLPEAPEEADRLADLEAEARRQGARIRRLSAGDSLPESGGVRIDCLHPPRGFGGSSNDRSLVLRVRHGAVSILFTGDVERTAERRLLGLGIGAVDLWKVPHHGSGSSSDPALLTALRPRLAVVSAGSGNPYGVPRPEVLRRHRRIGARVLRTDLDGSVLVESDGLSLRVRITDRATRRACSAAGALC